MKQTRGYLIFLLMVLCEWFIVSRLPPSGFLNSCGFANLWCRGMGRHSPHEKSDRDETAPWAAYAVGDVGIAACGEERGKIVSNRITVDVAKTHTW